MTRHALPQSSNWFRAQFGEDRRLVEYFGGRSEGFYVEVGAYDGLSMSNSYLFERLGWRGVLVEPIPKLADACRRNRPGSLVVECAAVGPGVAGSVQFEIAQAALDHSSLSLDRHHRAVLQRLTGGVETRPLTVPARTLDTILQEADAPKVDFVTVDVEGHEWEVLQGFTLDRWKPEIVIIERNANVPSRRICRHMARHGYRYLESSGPADRHAANDWFQRVSPRRLATRYWLMLETTVFLPAHARSWQALTGHCLRGLLSRLGLLGLARALKHRLLFRFRRERSRGGRT